MFNVHAQKIFLGSFVLLAAASMSQAQTASPLTATPATVEVTYQKPSTPGTTQNVVFKAASSTTFDIDPTTVPFWLTVGAVSGPATTTGVTVTFDPSAVAATMTAGGYNAFVHAKVSGYNDLVITVSLVVSDPASSLFFAQGTSSSFTWVPGQSYPTQTLNLVSSDAPIAYSITTQAVSPAAPVVPANWISVNNASGIAYNYGTPIVVSFLPAVLYNAAVDSTLSGTVTVTPSTGNAIVFTFTITIGEPQATLTRIFPNYTPVNAGSTPLTLIITGTGFGPAIGTSPWNNPTTVTVSQGNNSVVLDPTATPPTLVYVNSTTLIATIPVTGYLDTDGNTVQISVQNQNLTAQTTNGNAVSLNLNVTSAPIIYSITDAASLAEVGGGIAPTLTAVQTGVSPSFAPYELITLFGDNFGPTSGGTPSVSGTLDSNNRYSASLTTDGGPLQVQFFKSDNTTSIADAYLLFATENQINALVPSGVLGTTQTPITTAAIQVAVGASGSVKKSIFYPIYTAAEDPGIFTTTSSGTGQGAILESSNYSVNNQQNPGITGKDTVLIYMTGVGAPDSTGTDANQTKAAWPTTCSSTTSYLGVVNALASNPQWTSLDGAVIEQSNLKTNVYPPCMAGKNEVTVTINSKTATVSYAGWVAGSIAGLYQINVLVPSGSNPSTASPVVASSVPVVVTVNGVQSQPGVTMWVK